MKPQMYLKYSDHWDDGWSIPIGKAGKPDRPQVFTKVQ